ncbi:TrbC/VirB2 family protein [Lacibacterium aquatile]|uniref:TrbC/VirB2 family protein n=1 Tax=Lacibacterium aquatile TaxID=1168082 RepID=A0ABW5DRM7_9PROT
MCRLEDAISHPRTILSIRAILALASLSVIFLCAPDIAFASDTGMPWEGPLNRVIASLTGPVARGIGVLAIVGAGLAIAFGEGGAGVKRLLQVVLGLSIAFTASSFLLSLFGVASGYSL